MSVIVYIHENKDFLQMIYYAFAIHTNIIYLERGTISNEGHFCHFLVLGVFRILIIH